jgi:hypothetical protein
MPDRFSPSDAAIVDTDARNMFRAGFPLSGELNDLWNEIDAGNIGVTADAGDVDALALGGGHFTRDKNAAPGSTLLFAWKASRVLLNGRTSLAVSAGSLLLAASNTNYVEVDSLGVVTSNTSGFTAGRLPLWVIVTGPGSYTDVNVTSKKHFLVLMADGGVVGKMLSTAARTKEGRLDFGTIATAAGTTIKTLLLPTQIGTGTITKVRWVDKDALATSDVNYVKWKVVNKGAAGAGTQVLVDDAAASNTTKTTGGTALAAYTPRDLTLATLTIGNERDVTGGDVLEITLTVTGTLANALTESSLLVELTFAN